MKPRRPLEPIREPEQWRRYKDTDFYVSDQGRVKRIIKDREFELGFYDPTKQVTYVKIDKKNHIVKNLVYELFKGKIPDGYYVVHKNGMLRDDSIYNLEAVTVQKHGSRVGKYGNAQKVADLDKRIIYRSASEAGRRLNISRQSICHICRGMTKNPVYNLAWYDAENEKVYRGEWRNADS